MGAGHALLSTVVVAGQQRQEVEREFVYLQPPSLPARWDRYLHCPQEVPAPNTAPKMVISISSSVSVPSSFPPTGKRSQKPSQSSPTALPACPFSSP